VSTAQEEQKNPLAGLVAACYRLSMQTTFQNIGGRRLRDMVGE
jgi:hypothetical protein